MRCRTLVALAILVLVARSASAQALKIATFEADVTPPLGAPLCDALVPPSQHVDDLLLARGLVLLAEGPPIVLCALDWVGIGNTGHDAFRDAIAKAAKTTRERVCVHCLHQHDAPGCDFLADELLASVGLQNHLFDTTFARKAIARVADAARRAVQQARAVTHIGAGKALVESVASNRRVMGPDGKVKYVRYSSTKDDNIRAEPEGLIDPYLQVLSFWDGDTPLVAISYYATHPQSYYGKGRVSSDFPGLARSMRDKAQPGVVHIHFNGAGGNVTAGKYNDGAVENRVILGARLGRGMREAFEATRKTPVTAADLGWRVAAVALPASKAYRDPAEIAKQVADRELPVANRLRAARNLAWSERCAAGKKIDIACLRIGPAFVLHMPGELFIEYQLAAQKMRSGAPVMMAAYGDYGPGYIGTAIAYTQGGYETGPVSRVAPEVEDVLMQGMRELLK
jgi:hypothetical protein